MIITCPHCQTRYQVAAEAIGAAGRQVMCANCSLAWTASPVFPTADRAAADDRDADAFASDPDMMFTAEDEDQLDREFERTESAAAADGQRAQQRDEAMARRHKAISRKMPMARMRRVARLLVAALLVLVVTCAFAFRTEIVHAVPSLAGLYGALGLGTNVIGLDFLDVRTLRTTRNGGDVIVITGQIVNVTNRVANVPPVLVSLVNAGGRTLYEWTINPPVGSVLPGDRVSIETQLTGPPADAEAVRLSFVAGTRRGAGATQTPSVEDD